MLDRDTQRQIEELAAEHGGTVSVCVRNISNAVDYSFRGEVRMGSASIIKVPMIVEAMMQVRDGTLSLDAEFTIAPEELCKGSGVISRLHHGLILTLKDLLTLMIIVSDNTATNILIDVLGMQNVNSTMSKMGFTGTVLQRKMHDWKRIEEGFDNYLVAREIAELLVKIARKEAAGGEWDEMIVDILRRQLYSDQLGLLLPRGARLANKTGQRAGLVHDCGIVTAEKFRYAIAACTDNAGEPGEAKMMIGRISRLVYDCLAKMTE